MGASITAHGRSSRPSVPVGVARSEAVIPADSSPRAKAEGGPRVRGRKPRTQQMLGRLRHELCRIDPPPASMGEAHCAIADAMDRAQLGGWSLPGLGAAANRRHADGSISLPLIAHLIVFNPWGAFRIVDLLRPATPYFEMAGRDRRGFRMPSG